MCLTSASHREPRGDQAILHDGGVLSLALEATAAVVGVTSGITVASLSSERSSLPAVRMCACHFQTWKHVSDGTGDFASLNRKQWVAGGQGPHPAQPLATHPGHGHGQLSLDGLLFPIGVG